MDTNINNPLHQAGQAATACFQEAIASIDSQFGEGYAEDHPELTAAVTIATSIDLNHRLLTQALEKIALEVRHTMMVSG